MNVTELQTEYIYSSAVSKNLLLTRKIELFIIFIIDAIKIYLLSVLD